MTVCPGSGPVGTSVTISGAGCKYLSLVVFLGPGSYIGANGAGGGEIPITPGAHGDFTVKYTIPATYTSGGRVQQVRRVLPGQVDEFGSYPANVCSAPFKVTAGNG